MPSTLPRHGVLQLRAIAGTLFRKQKAHSRNDNERVSHRVVPYTFLLRAMCRWQVELYCFDLFCV